MKCGIANLRQSLGQQQCICFSGQPDSRGRVLWETYRYSMSWKLYRKLHRNGWFRCSSILRSLIIFRTLSERTISSFRMYFSANVRPVSFRSTIRTFPNAPLPTTRSKRKWLRLTSSVMHIGFPLELPMAECGLSARGWLSCQEGPVVHACQCLLMYVREALRYSGRSFPSMYCEPPDPNLVSFPRQGVARDGTYSNCPSDSVSCRSSSQLFNFNAKLECTIFSPSNRRMSPHVPPKSEILRSKSEKQRAHEQPSSHAE